MDTTTGLSRRFGFIEFSDEHTLLRALKEMQNNRMMLDPISTPMARSKNKAKSAASEITTVFYQSTSPYCLRTRGACSSNQIWVYCCI
ncbi:uncharacterized protein B0P05DRAFT_538731 [Gilbertella persicaria]|uniref:uncharacterized protein n=1 Tax=Gilbertella persicaria TaxID=101096 RepID=UPI00221E9EC5|nr:uncharacterized protein B0P05DRAFT_538731 [Gilbertella persicaria]KAI8081941.1 hypothetical protein B0P05DRAFT_538731 [Gilbertella persicaria]